MRQFRTLLLHDDLLDESLVLVDIQVEDVHLPVDCTRREDSRRVRCPCHVAHCTAQIVDEQGIPRVTRKKTLGAGRSECDLLEVDVPDLHRPVSGAADEDLRMEMIPANGVDGHVMRVERVQELIAVGFRALVDLSLLGADDEKVILLFVEVEASSTTCRTRKREARRWPKDIRAYRAMLSINLDRVQRLASPISNGWRHCRPSHSNGKRSRVTRRTLPRLELL